jgi:soluble lytic murein transglycosylase-like protein
MITDSIVDMARKESTTQGVSLALILGVIETESSGDTWAYNPEPKYHWLWDFKNQRPFRAITKAEDCSEFPPDDFSAPAGADTDAEWWGQQASWGLMQVMGAVAREHGYGGRFLTSLCDPATGVWVGTVVLKSLLKRWGDPEMAAASYNAGSVSFRPGGKEFTNQRYVDKVITASKRWQAMGVA